MSQDRTELCLQFFECVCACVKSWTDLLFLSYIHLLISFRLIEADYPNRFFFQLKIQSNSLNFFNWFIDCSQQ